MKRITVLFLTFLTCISLVGCSKKYVTNIESAKISEALQRSIVTDGGYREPSERFMTINLGVPEHYIKDYRIIVAKDDTNQNEIGVFRANTKSDAKEIAKYCRKYLDNEIANYNPDYNPDEAVKLQNADVNVFGVYVIYTILSTDDTDYTLIVIDNLISEGL